MQLVGTGAAQSAGVGRSPGDRTKAGPGRRLAQRDPWMSRAGLWGAGDLLQHHWDPGADGPGPQYCAGRGSPGEGRQGQSVLWVPSGPWQML